MMPWEADEHFAPEAKASIAERVPLGWRIRFELKQARYGIRHNWPRPIAFRLPARLVYWVLIRAVAETAARMHPQQEPDAISPSTILAYWERKSRKD